jgi:hypothetical protein
MNTRVLSRFDLVLVLIPLTLGVPPGRAADANLTVNYSTVVRTLPADFHGVNYVAFWDAVQGSVGSREALRRAAGAHYIRFPGGAPADWIDWANPYADGWSSTSTADLWNYAAPIGARLILQTNPTSNHNNNPSGTHAADWLTYCVNNSIDVALWEIGNEPDLVLVNDFDYPAMQWYFDKFNEHAAAIHARLPGTKVAGPVGANAWFWWGLHSLQMFIERCGANADAVSLHWYYTGADPTYDQIKIAAQNWQPNMDYIRSVTTKPLYITEWNSMGFNDNSDVNKWAGLCLANSDVIGAFAKSGVQGHTMFGCIHNVHHNWGILAGQGDYRAQDSPSPNYFVLPLWSKMGDRVLNVSNSADPNNVVSAWAHKKSNGDVQVMLINKATGSRTAAVSFTGFDPTGKTVQIDELRSSSGAASFDVYYNGVFNPQPATADLPASTSTTSSGATFNRTLPAISVTVLNFINSGGGGTPTFTSSASPNPSSIPAGGATTITLTITCTAGSLTGGLIDLEIYDPSGVKVAQPTWTGQSFTTGQQRQYTYNWTAGSTTGAHSLRVGVFSGDWSQLYHWNGNAGTVTVTAGGAGTGLRGDYFDNMDFTAFKSARTDGTVNFDWGTTTPGGTALTSGDTFTVRWTGLVQPQYSQTYTFYTTTDDGVRLWVNNTLLIDKWINQGPTEWSGTIALTANQKYPIKMEYYENTQGAVAKLSWSSSSTPKAIIPQSRLYTDGTFQQSSALDGIVSIEAEHHSANVTQGGKTWTPVNPSGFSGDCAYQALPNSGGNVDTGYLTGSPRLDFKVNFVKTGTHYVWIRGKAASGSDDSCHAGLDGAALSTCDRMTGFGTGWTWSKSTMDGPVATFNVASTGLHTVNVWMREDGFEIDKIVLTVNSNYTPTGTGPAESSRQ